MCLVVANMIKDILINSSHSRHPWKTDVNVMSILTNGIPFATRLNANKLGIECMPNMRQKIIVVTKSILFPFFSLFVQHFVLSTHTHDIFLPLYTSYTTLPLFTDFTFHLRLCSFIFVSIFHDQCSGFRCNVSALQLFSLHALSSTID